MNQGIQLRKGDIVRFDNGELAEVERDNVWVTDIGPHPHWGSVWLVGQYPPVFTHKGGITLVHTAMPKQS